MFLYNLCIISGIYVTENVLNVMLNRNLKVLLEFFVRKYPVTNKELL
jgi:hypothetical protein